MRYFPYAKGDRFSKLRAMVRLFQIQNQTPEREFTGIANQPQPVEPVPFSAAEKAAQKGTGTGPCA